MYDHQFNDWSYVYLGYFIEDEAQLLAFADAYREAIASGRDFTGDLPVGKGKGTGGGDSLRRMQSLETLLASDAPPVKRPSEIPVVIEWPENHRHPGGHVVYLDGHTEFVDYPGKFPMTPAVIAALRDLDNYAPRVRYESYQD
ncbi:MAG: hypothetical protein GC168_20260 [Candidatus Hydrogenedens sp.]|nr:hypothetical protein [Candidatus Hydrogenedens sp.]